MTSKNPALVYTFDPLASALLTVIADCLVALAEQASPDAGVRRRRLDDLITKMNKLLDRMQEDIAR